jgi:hypothetical protein
MNSIAYVKKSGGAETFGINTLTAFTPTGTLNIGSNVQFVGDVQINDTLHLQNGQNTVPPVPHPAGVDMYTNAAGDFVVKPDSDSILLQNHAAAHAADKVYLNIGTTGILNITPNSGTVTLTGADVTHYVTLHVSANAAVAGDPIEGSLEITPGNTGLPDFSGLVLWNSAGDHKCSFTVGTDNSLYIKPESTIKIQNGTVGHETDITQISTTTAGIFSVWPSAGQVNLYDKDGANPCSIHIHDAGELMAGSVLIEPSGINITMPDGHVLVLESTAAATNVPAGALIAMGGIFANKNLLIMDATAAGAGPVGAIVCTGGINCGDNLIVSDATAAGAGPVGAVVTTGGINCGDNLIVNDATDADATVTTGSVVTLGGIACTKKLHTGDALSVHCFGALTDYCTTSVAAGGIASITSVGLNPELDVAATTQFKVLNDTDSNPANLALGACLVTGGLVCAKKLQVGDNLTIHHNDAVGDCITTDVASGGIVTLTVAGATPELNIAAAAPLIVHNIVDAAIPHVSTASITTDGGIEAAKSIVCAGITLNSTTRLTNYSEGAQMSQNWGTAEAPFRVPPTGTLDMVKIGRLVCLYVGAVGATLGPTMGTVDGTAEYALGIPAIYQPVVAVRSYQMHHTSAGTVLGIVFNVSAAGVVSIGGSWDNALSYDWGTFGVTYLADDQS